MIEDDDDGFLSRDLRSEEAAGGCMWDFCGQAKTTQNKGNP